jgi:peptidoglycan-associated lipoprotein
MKMKSVFVALIATLALGLTSCGSASKKNEMTDGGSQMGSEVLELNGDSDSSKAGALRTVFFDYDSASLTGSARATLDSNAEYLKKMTAVEVQVEGHCDERGSAQYNLALGERRALAVKEYLVAMGVEAKRITTISFGKERPLSYGHDDGAWSQNRRGNFLVTAK